DPNELNDLSYDEAYGQQLHEMNTALWEFLLDNDDFIVHDTVNTAWQLSTRRELERHCQQVAREAPHGEGPLINPIDAASAKGEILD
ncbi:MAG: hypothetical protein HRU15_11570, partial [Planctomycetes bacterium]|nr:hypothetical protein [Planctomycetota bacterium]